MATTADDAAEGSAQMPPQQPPAEILQRKTQEGAEATTKRASKKRSSEISCADVKVLCKILAVMVLLAIGAGLVIRFYLPTSAATVAMKAAMGVGAVQLTAGDFDTKIKGKGAFVKFLAPW